MIAYVEGRLLDAGEASAVVLTPGGVGYELQLTAPALSRLPALGGEVCFHVHTVVREDAFDLFGFETPDERRVFAALISIPKLGPRKGLAILSMHGVDDLYRIAQTEDLAALTSVPGIGLKTGQQILFELKYKLKTAPGARPSAPAASGGTVLGDTLAGLAGLGYSSEEARPVVAKVLEDEPDLDVSQALREALKALGKKR